MPFGVIPQPRANYALTKCLISLIFELKALANHYFAIKCRNPWYSQWNN